MNACLSVSGFVHLKHIYFFSLVLAFFLYPQSTLEVIEIDQEPGFSADNSRQDVYSPQCNPFPPCPASLVLPR